MWRRRPLGRLATSTTTVMATHSTQSRSALACCSASWRRCSGGSTRTTCSGRRLETLREPLLLRRAIAVSGPQFLWCCPQGCGPTPPVSSRRRGSGRTGQWCKAWVDSSLTKQRRAGVWGVCRRRRHITLRPHAEPAVGPTRPPGCEPPLQIPAARLTSRISIIERRKLTLSLSVNSIL